MFRRLSVTKKRRKIFPVGMVVAGPAIVSCSRLLVQGWLQRILPLLARTNESCKVCSECVL